MHAVPALAPLPPPPPLLQWLPLVADRCTDKNGGHCFRVFTSGFTRSYKVPNVLLLSNCPAILYSTRAMSTLHTLRHNTDAGRITLPAAQPLSGPRQKATHVNISDDGSSYSVTVAFLLSGESPPAPLIAPKGSVTLNGVSLTVNEVSSRTFGVNIVPHTWDVTNLGRLSVGDKVNFEADTLARYVARQLEARL